MSTLSREECEDLLGKVVGRAWRVPVLRVLSDGPRRYADIRGQLALKGASPGDGTISQTLRDLARYELAGKHPADSARGNWQLTDRGVALLQVLDHIVGPTDDQADDEQRPIEPAQPTTLASTVDPSARRQCREMPVGEDEACALNIDTTVAHPARRYNYWLGGKDNFEADRKSAYDIEKHFRGMRAGVRANRDVLGRMVRYFTADAGIRQFLDIGPGLPTVDNTHEVAQRIAPQSHVLYVDNDPLVMRHAQALLTSAPEGATDFIKEDLREPYRILAAMQERSTLDPSRPIALMLIAVLHFIRDEEDPRGIVAALVDALPSGSYLAATHFTVDFMPEEEKAVYQQLLDAGRSDILPRTRAEFTALFDGMELVDPGIELITQWRPDGPSPTVDPSRISMWGGVARKP